MFAESYTTYRGGVQVEGWTLYYKSKFASIHIKENKLMFRCSAGITMAAFKNEKELFTQASVWMKAAEELLKQKD